LFTTLHKESFYICQHKKTGEKPGLNVIHSELTLIAAGTKHRVNKQFASLWSEKRSCNLSFSSWLAFRIKIDMPQCRAWIFPQLHSVFRHTNL